ncbi:MAG: hypothetical protein OMM_02809 [Candidatus Magnetoglobus multicellularis str. Araruama]|uniref:Uncharacterized protein n=1 Tax=Candidatus Magnetoglobus multicellularis str. Araruama TaxID=890399 RepID=A0A1V1P898_9BACT|nr:MAG: hypothetical protein OMM_02809 [Candidatus Magnetoglobus multicellularis str. Araruama]
MSALNPWLLQGNLPEIKFFFNFEPVHKWHVAQKRKPDQSFSENNGVYKRISQHINHFMTELFHTRQLAYARIRSNKDIDIKPSIEIEKKLDQYPIRIRIEKLSQNLANMQVRLISSYSSNDVFSVILTGENQTYKARKMQNGKAFFERLPFETYDLTLTQNTDEKAGFQFSINEVGLYER